MPAPTPGCPPTGAVKAAAHMPGHYYIRTCWVDARCVYTNRTPSSAMRGFGVTGADFALEVQMDKLARLVGMDPMEFRILNAYRDGDMKAHRRATKKCGPHRVRPGRGPARRLAALGTFPGDVLDARRRRRRARRDHADTGTGNGIGERSSRRPGPPAGPEAAVAAARSSTAPDASSGGTAGSPPRRHAVLWREGAGCRACWERGGVRDDGEKTRARDRIGQLPDRHEPRWRSEPGARAFQPQRKVHRRLSSIDLDRA